MLQATWAFSLLLPTSFSWLTRRALYLLLTLSRVYTGLRLLPVRGLGKQRQGHCRSPRHAGNVQLLMCLSKVFYAAMYKGSTRQSLIIIWLFICWTWQMLLPIAVYADARTY